MASAYSTLINYGKPIAPYNLEAIEQSTLYKQQKYDANKAKLDDMISQLGNVDLMKEEDKEYLYNRINQVVSNPGINGSLDFSSTQVVDAITSNINNIIDPNVQQAMQSTRNARSYFEEVDYYKKEKPDQYNARNAAYGAQGINAWLNDGQVGSKLGSASYTPYQDVDGTISEAIENADKYLQNVTKVTTKDGDYFVDEENTVVSPERLEALISNQFSGLSPQIEINSYYELSPEFGYNDYKKAKNGQIKQINDKISLYKDQLENGGFEKGSAQYNSLVQAVDDLTYQSQSYTRERDNVMSDTQARNAFYKDIKTSNYLQTYGGVLSSEVSIRENSIPLQREKLELEKQKYADKVAFEIATKVRNPDGSFKMAVTPYTTALTSSENPDAGEIVGERRAETTAIYESLFKEGASGAQSVIDNQINGIKTEKDRTDFYNRFGYTPEEVKGNESTAMRFLAKNLADGTISSTGIPPALTKAAKEYWAYQELEQDKQNALLQDVDVQLNALVDNIVLRPNEENAVYNETAMVATPVVMTDDNGEKFIGFSNVQPLGQVYTPQNLDTELDPEVKLPNGQPSTFRNLLKLQFASELGAEGRGESGGQDKVGKSINYLANALTEGNDNVFITAEDKKSAFRQFFEQQKALRQRTGLFETIGRLFQGQSAGELPSVEEILSEEPKTKSTQMVEETQSLVKTRKVNGQEINPFEQLANATSLNSYRGNEQSLHILEDLSNKFDKRIAKDVDGTLYGVTNGEDSGLEYIDAFDLNSDANFTGTDYSTDSERLIRNKYDNRGLGFQDNLKGVAIIDKDIKNTLTSILRSNGSLAGIEDGNASAFTENKDGSFTIVVADKDDNIHNLELPASDVPSAFLELVDSEKSASFIYDARTNKRDITTVATSMSRSEFQTQAKNDILLAESRKAGTFATKEDLIEDYIDKAITDGISEKVTDGNLRHAFETLLGGQLTVKAVPIGNTYTMEYYIGNTLVREDETNQVQLNQLQRELLNTLPYRQKQVLDDLIKSEGGLEMFLTKLARAQQNK